jgi:hypothetical protein
MQNYFLVSIYPKWTTKLGRKIRLLYKLTKSLLKGEIHPTRQWKLVKKYSKKINSQIQKREWKKVDLIPEYLGKKKAWKQIQLTYSYWKNVQLLVIPKWHKKTVMKKQQDLLIIYDNLKLIQSTLQLKN